MEYLKVSWIHEDDNFPILLYSELDEERYEVRKIEIYRNDLFGLASLNCEYNGSILGAGPVPDTTEINKEPEFIVHETTKEEFEEVWMRYTSSMKR